ncbi:MULTISPECIES: methyl-accepting chemotaxis protein [Vibrio]|uniref:methyl-accepting chemotaxis protein n=1 Tax=Vibrio TaxID=662 RepID=UPI0001B93B75|nr:MULTISPECIES: methyl-accepting chemotaxis protein [Vibrio]EEX34392.1 methyl-accepting chemotaxis protein [Vibrio coralliilyticus ATCC BAA-450]MDE3898437.1 methyl-accepting chemotaxis protein [Vibrio sp. CC007]
MLGVKQLGLKKILLLSVMILVGFSVSGVGTVLYYKEKLLLTEMLKLETESYVEAQARNIETLINEKVDGVNKLAQQYKTKEFIGNAEQIIEQTHFLANAMNLNSAVLAFESGDAYWNQVSDNWPDHKYAGDVTQRSWYQDGRQAPSVTVTEPYTTDGEVFWLTIIEKIKGGTVSVDMKLDFLNDLVEKSNVNPDSVAFILNHDATVLASSSDTLRAGESAYRVDWLKSAVKRVVGETSSVSDYQLDGKDNLLFSHRVKAGDKNWYFVVGVNKSLVFSKLESARNDAIVFSIISILICVALSYVLIQVLYKPILTLKETIINLSSGEADLTARLHIDSDDDVGDIARGVNCLIENLQQMMIDIQSATSALKSNVSRMRRNSEQNLDMLQRHVSETEQVVTAIEEMAATAESMASDAVNTASLTHQAKEASSQSRQIVETSQHTVSGLISDVNVSSGHVRRMSEETQSINAILGVIGEIAEQTNLLALNAAIEAARAGEQGRGFAVVADEVRSLASRTKDSTNKVEMAIEHLSKGTSAVVKSMEDTKSRCQDTEDGASRVAASLDQMSDFVEGIADLSVQMATSAEEQSSVTQELSRNMSVLGDIVGKLDESGHSALRDAKDVDEVNSQLMIMIQRFKF